LHYPIDVRLARSIKPMSLGCSIEIRLGRSNADIARSLHMSEATVRTHITHLLEKLAAANRVQLAIAAFRAGLLE
jgi:DNA-binding NarL/FixJ family response regulator